MSYQFHKAFKLGRAELSENAPVFIIAEAGVNHNGNLGLALKMIEVAAASGVDAVKFQAFHTDELILKNVEKAPYQKSATSAAESQSAMLKKLELRLEQFRELKARCEEKGLVFLVTPFDEVSLDELDALKLDAYKVASTDLTNLPFLKKIAQKRKPIILSTGMSHLLEVEQALAAIHPIHSDLILLHCTGNYPTPPEEVNLRVLATFRERFGVLVGYSDHTEGIGASPYAAALGAKVIEKHFTLDQSMEGPDHRASLSPEELQKFVKSIRVVERYLGSAVKAPQPSELNTRLSLQKNLVAKTMIKKGERFSGDNVIAKRTGGQGISPLRFDEVCRSRAPKDFQKDEVITLEQA